MTDYYRERRNAERLAAQHSEVQGAAKDILKQLKDIEQYLYWSMTRTSATAAPITPRTCSTMRMSSSTRRTPTGPRTRPFRRRRKRTATMPHSDEAEFDALLADYKRVAEENTRLRALVSTLCGEIQKIAAELGKLIDKDNH